MGNSIAQHIYFWNPPLAALMAATITDVITSHEGVAEIGVPYLEMAGLGGAFGSCGRRD